MLASWSISARIYAGFAVVLVLLGGLAAFTFLSMTTVSGLFSEYRGTARQTLLLNDLSQDLFTARLSALKYRMTPNAEAAAEVHKHVEEVIGGVEEGRALFAPGSAVAGELRTLAERTRAYDDAFDRMRALQARREAEVETLIETGEVVRVTITDVMTSAYRDDDPEAAYHGGMALQELLLGRYFALRYLLRNDAESYDLAEMHLMTTDTALRTLMPKLRNGRRRDLVQNALDNIATYLREFAAVRDTITERNALNADKLDRIGPRMQADFERLTSAVVDRQNRLGPEARDRIGATRVTAVAIGVAAVLLGAALAFVIGRWIAGAVHAMAQSMNRMAEGDLAIAVTGDEHGHELGRMAAALKVFQQNGLEKRRLDAEAREAAERETARAAETDRLRARVGDAVEKAAGGDFTGRVPADFAEDGLNRFAQMVNRLLETVSAGVSETARVMAALARGDLQTRMDGAYEGAFAELQGNVNGTVEKLRETVGEIQGAADAIRTATGEIAQGAGDLSSRAENQAASLEEIAATMEQMSATVKKNAENAVSASNLSADARERADKGGQVVSEAVTAMGEIEAGSGKIAEIVNVIDGFAFQTNLLALNAAVEAARAGEAGKGFAVVASEVRTLAQRSAEAARDINGLIQESSQQVSNGVRLVTETGSALSEIVEAIRQVSDTVTEISEASREQSAGVDEITAAITSMDEITQQNSALADESATAARGLGDRAVALEETMRFFTVSVGGGGGWSADAAGWDADAAMDATDAHEASFAAQ